MATIDDRQLLPRVTPSTSVPDPAVRLQVSPTAFGGAQARGTEQFGADVSKAGQHWGEIVADDVANQWTDRAQKILYGDASLDVTNPDGSVTPNVGYLGLKGDAALRERANYEKKFDDLYKESISKLASFDQRKTFDGYTRRQRAIYSGHMGSHADKEAITYGVEVNRATIKQNANRIQTDPNNEDTFLNSTSDMVNAATKAAELRGARKGDAIWEQAASDAKSAAVETRIHAIGTEDPRRALGMVEHYKNDLGSHYSTLYGQYRTKARVETGKEFADVLVDSQAPLTNGSDAKSVLRQFEGMRRKAYPDHSPGTVTRMRVGFGSDTVTRPDGTHETVGPNTVVTEEDAERDLERRAKLSQGQLRKAVGDEVWNQLDPRIQASLTSVVYNYGRVPDGVAEAVKTLDANKIAQSIMALAGHNNGINRGRRAREAANILNEKPEPLNQADVLKQIENSDLPPEAKTAATARANHKFAIQHYDQVDKKAAFDTRVKDSTAEAMQTGGSSNQVSPEEFARQYGASRGAVEYQKYQSDLEFGAKKQSFETESDDGIKQIIETMIPANGTPGYEHKMANVRRLQEYATRLEKQRTDDPGGAVSRDPIVQQAFKSYDPKKPETFAAVITARLAAQSNLKIPEPLQSAISDGEAKQYATALKPVSKEGSDPQLQEQTINGIVDHVRLKYGDHAPAAMARILYHVTMKKEAAEVLAAAMIRNSKGEEPQLSPTEVRRVQIERDAERAALLAGQREEQAKERAQQGGVLVDPVESMMMGMPAVNADTVKGVVKQADQKSMKPFNEAVDVLRSDPGKYMPFFVKKFGEKSVPADLRQYIPRPEAPADGR